MVKLSHIYFIMFILLVAGFSCADTHYVSTNGANDSVNGYNTWAGAATQIQWAVNAAVDDDTVLVSNGVYKTMTPVIMSNPDGVSTQVSCVVVTNKIILKSVNGPNVTVIDGDYGVITARCVWVAGNATVDGFTVRNGYGVNLSPPSSQNYADITGGGIRIGWGGGTVTNCIIHNNYAWYGGGIEIDDSIAIVANCTIYSNATRGFDGAGGGINSAYVSGSIKKCVFLGNYCGQTSSGEGGGGAISLNQNTFTIQNCLFYGNTSDGYGGAVNIYGTYGVSSLDNCTIAGNTAANKGGGLRMDNPAGLVRNTIIYNNSATTADPDVYTANSFFSNCCMSVTNEWTTGRGNITNNPLFVDAANTNYRLSANSPCLNTGQNQDWMTNAVDLDGRIRIRYGRVDMGAYERIYEGTIYKFH